MEPMVAHGVLAVEMEASALYTLAAAHGRKALAICTVSDHIVTGEETTAAEREQSFGAMVDIALAAASAAAASRPTASWRRTRVRGGVLGALRRQAGTAGLRRHPDRADRLLAYDAQVAAVLEDGDTVTVVVDDPARDPLAAEVDPDEHVLLLRPVERVAHSDQRGGSEHERRPFRANC